MNLQTNLKLIQYANPDLEQQLSQIDDRSLESPEVNGTHIFTLIDDTGREFYSASTVDPQYEAEELLRTVNMDNKGYVILGIPSVTLIEKLLDAKIKSASIMIIEKDLRLVKRFLQLVNLSKYFADQVSHIFFVHGDLESIKWRVNFILDSFEGFQFFKPEVVRTFPTLRVNEALYNQVYIAVYEIVRNKCMMSGNQFHSTLKGIKQELENLPEMAKLPRLKDLKDRYKNKPIICVASGPSLDKQLPYLKEMQGKALIICAVSSFRVLINNGIEPDIVSVLERTPQAMDDCFNDIPIPSKTWLFVMSMVDPRLFHFWPNVIIPCFRENSYLNWFLSEALGGVGTILTAHSVAHMNLMIAHHLGGNPIVLIGQDLAFSETGRTHSEHSHYEKFYQARQAKLAAQKANPAPQDEAPKVQKTNYLNERVMVDGYYGGKVPSKRLWLLFLNSFESMVKLVARPVINATEGGADIKGTVKQPFREFCETYANSVVAPPNTFAEELKANVNYSDRTLHDVFAKYKVLIEEMSAVVDEARQWLHSMNDYLESLNELTPDREKSVLRKANRVAMYFDILHQKFFSQPYMVAFFRPVNAMLHVNANPISRINSIERSKELFEHYAYFANVLISGTQLVVQTIEQQFHAMLPPIEEDMGEVDQQQLLDEAVSSCSAYIPELMKACDQLLEQLNAGQTGWFVLFGEFVNGIHWLNDIIGGLQQHQDPRVAHISLATLLDLLKQCESYLVANDLVSFADCIGFEIKSVLQSYLDEMMKGVLN